MDTDSERKQMRLYTADDYAEHEAARSREWIANYDRTAHIGASPHVHAKRDYHRAVSALPAPVTKDALNEVSMRMRGVLAVERAGHCDVCDGVADELVAFGDGWDDVSICKSCVAQMASLFGTVKDKAPPSGPVAADLVTFVAHPEAFAGDRDDSNPCAYEGTSILCMVIKGKGAP